MCVAVPGVKDVRLAKQVRFMSHCQMKFICSIFVLVETLTNLFFSFVKMDDVIVLADADLFLVSTYSFILVAFYLNFKTKKSKTKCQEVLVNLRMFCLEKILVGWKACH